jgi:hypothetical protein
MAENLAPPTLAASEAPPTISAPASKGPSSGLIPATAPVEKPPDDGSKLKTFLGVLRR